MIEKLKLDNVSVEVNGKEILSNIDMEIKRGEIVVLMGPNGAGKSTIANVVMGNPKYKIINGNVILNEKILNDVQTNERAKLGVFMSFQHPAEVDGVTMMNFLRVSYNSIKGKEENAVSFKKILTSKMEELNMDLNFRKRFLNSGFSGGEKKRSEILQLLLLEPKYAFLDEIDSGLDVDALKLVSKNICKIAKEKNMGVLIITHYNKILEFLNPDRVIVLKSGRIDRVGGPDLIKEIEIKGYEGLNL